jgi:hypothetical protein
VYTRKNTGQLALTELLKANATSINTHTRHTQFLLYLSGG